MSSVSCTGRESHIGECSHVTSSPHCHVSDGAGVTCVDPTTLALKGGGDASTGSVYIIEQPVCADRWGINNARVVCNQLFREKFAMRHSKGVPTAVPSSFNVSQKNVFSINNVNCSGTETNLAQCNFSAHVNCETSKIAGVQCGKCSPDDLLSIVDNLKVDGKIGNTYKSVVDTIAMLREKCWDWDCSVAQAEYPEYCDLSAFLNDALLFITESKDKHHPVQLQTKFDYGMLLEHYFMNENFATIREHLFRLGDKGDDFRKKLATYFKNLAVFDKEKSDEELSVLRQRWYSTEVDINQRQQVLQKQLTPIFVCSFEIVGIELVELAAELAVRIASLANPFEWNASEIFGIKDVIKKMAQAGAKLARLSRVYDKGLKELKAIALRINDKRKKTVQKFKKVIDFLHSRETKRLTLKMARDFISKVSDFEPSVGAVDIAQYQSTLSDIVDTVCEVIKDPDSIGGAVISTISAAMGACPTVRSNVAVIAQLYIESTLEQIGIIRRMSSLARAMIAEDGADSITKVLADDLKVNMERHIIRWKALFLLQTHKIALIQRACEYITYINHGQEDAVCKKLLENPNLDAGVLVSYNYKKDMCECSTCSSVHDVFPVPAAINHGNNPFPKGTIDLSLLYNTTSVTNGWMNFKIPDNQWLVDNGWISSDMLNEGPFYLQQFEPYYPPVNNESYPYAVKTKMNLLSSNFQGKYFTMQGGLDIRSQYHENRDTPCDDEQSSLYNTPNCVKHFNKVCVTTSGKIHGPIYPLLVNSSWRISLNSPVPLTKPFPGHTFYIKVKAKFCWKSAGNKKARKWNRHGNRGNHCCYTRGMYFDQVAGMKEEGRGACKPCDEGSNVRLFGYYCEKCGAGYQPRKDGGYSCEPCPVGTYKKHGGKDSCKACPSGTTTTITGQVKCTPRKQ